MGWFNAPCIIGERQEFIGRTGRAPAGLYCKNSCKHADCAEVRERRSRPCQYCNEFVKAGEKVFMNEERTAYVHAKCTLEKEAEKQGG